MNEVKVFKMERTTEVGKHHYERVFDYYATFCEWGCNYEEFESGPGNFSTAIVKKLDGQIENIPAEWIQFNTN